MFREWGFLITEMTVLIILAALLGLFVGWLIWGRRAVVELGTLETDRLKADLSACRDRLKSCEAAMAGKNAEVSALQSDRDAARAQVAGMTRDYDKDGVLEGPDEGEKPTTLEAARDGQPDDLKQIKGIGPKLEKLCNALGFYHFDQIAAWTDQEVAWVDANLEGFKGRVSRDEWVAQAKLLAAGGETEFSKRVEDGDVY